MQKRLKHRLLLLTMIVTKAVFVQIVLKILGTDMMIDAPDTILDVAPEAVDGLSMNVASDVDFCGNSGDTILNSCCARVAHGPGYTRYSGRLPSARHR